MKRIEIYQENTQPIILQDDDESNISKYTKKLCKAIEASKVTIIETSNCSLILRPYKIVGIKISEDKKLSTKKTKIKVTGNGNITNKRKIDIITDKE